MSCSSCGAAFAGACGRGSACAYDFHFGEPPKQSSSTSSPPSSNSGSPLDGLNEYFASGEFVRDITPTGPLRDPSYYTHEVWVKEKEEERRRDEAVGKLFKYGGLALTSPVWFPFMIVKGTLDEKNPGDKANVLKAALATIGIWGVIGLGATMYNAHEKDTAGAARHAPHASSVSPSGP